jgi:hypothetical protein
MAMARPDADYLQFNWDLQDQQEEEDDDLSWVQDDAALQAFYDQVYQEEFNRLMLEWQEEKRARAIYSSSWPSQPPEKFRTGGAQGSSPQFQTASGATCSFRAGGALGSSPQYGVPGSFGAGGARGSSPQCGAPPAVLEPVEPMAVLEPVEPLAVLHSMESLAVLEPVEPLAVLHSMESRAVLEPVEPLTVLHSMESLSVL